MRRFLPVVILMTAVWLGCGGSKSSTTTTVAVTISPTTATIAGGATQQFTATVTGSTNTAVTWAVNGENGGDATIGTINSSGLYTAPTVLPASLTQTITATSAADTTKDGLATVTLSAPTVTITISPTNASVPAGSTQQFTSTVTSSDNNTAVTWSVNGCTVPATCGTVTSTGLYTAPSAPPREAITVTVTSTDDPAFSASAPVSVQFGKASLNGNYVFQVTQPDNGSGSGFALRAGTFVADGAGNIISGVEDANSSAGGVLPDASFTGTYNVGSDGRGTATITDSAGSHSFAFVLGSSTRGQMIEVDSGAATGLLRQQDQTAIAAVSGPFVFSLLGDSGGPAAAVGQVTFTGNTISGSQDTNVGGTVTPDAVVAGAFSVGAQGRGTAMLNSSNFAFYIINASTLALIDIDAAGTRVAGPAFAQSAATFTTGSLNSSTYFVSGNAIPGDKPYAQAGRFDTDGTSKLNGGVFDTNNAGTLTSNTAFSNTASYTLPASPNGRGTLSTGTSNFIFWLASSSQGVVLESDASAVATGLLFQQQTGISSIAGGYEFLVGGGSADGTTAQATDGQLLAGAFGVLSGTEDFISGGALQTGSGAALSAKPSLVIAANGRGTATLTPAGQASAPFDFYLISADRFIMLSAGSSSVLSGVGERQCSDCQF